MTKVQYLPTYGYNPVWLTAAETYHIPNILPIFAQHLDALPVHLDVLQADPRPCWHRGLFMARQEPKQLTPNTASH